MVLPSPTPDAPHVGEWLRQVARPLRLTRDGVLLLLDEARPAALRPLVRTLAEFDPNLHVHLDARQLAALPDRATALLRLRIADAEWLNLRRPMFAQRRLRVILWSESGVTAQVRDIAPDFFDWISHVIECPALVPDHIIAGLRASPAFPGVAWHGSLDPVPALVAAFPDTHCERRTWSRKYTDIIAALRSAAPGWIVWDELPNTRGLQRLRFALREVGRTDLRCLVTNPPTATLGFWPIDADPADWDDAAASLTSHGRSDGPRLAALTGLEPRLVEDLAALRSLCAPGELDARLRAAEDAGAVATTLAPESYPLFDLATRRAPSHALRRLALEESCEIFIQTVSERVQDSLARWSEIARSPGQRAPNERWTITGDELMIWASRQHLASVKLSFTPPPLPEGVLALEALLCPESAPTDVIGRERLVGQLYFFAHFDTAFLWASRGPISESLQAELDRFVKGNAPSSAGVNIQIDLRFQPGQTSPFSAAAGFVLPRPESPLTEDPERSLEELWRKDHDLLYEPDFEFATRCNQLGEALSHKGHHETGIRLLTRSLRNYELLFGPEHFSVGLAKGQLAPPLDAIGETEKAHRYAREALTIFRDTLGDSHPVTQGAVRQFASQLIARGEHEQAWSITRDVLRTALREIPPTLEIGETLQLLGTLELMRGRARTAQQHFERALQIAAQHAGQTSHPAAVTHQHIALALQSQGQPDRAIDHMRRARAIMEHVHGPDSREAIQQRTNLATLLEQVGQWFEAEVLLRRNLGIRDLDHETRLGTLTNLAKVLAEGGRTEEAETMLRDALADASATPGITAATRGALTVNLAALYSRTGRIEQARKLLRHYIHDPRADPDEAAFAAIGLARELAAHGDFAEALSLAERGLARAHVPLVATANIPLLRQQMLQWSARLPDG
jgi:tetratricopeptide (TPR) repeat protein